MNLTRRQLLASTGLAIGGSMIGSRMTAQAAHLRPITQVVGHSDSTGQYWIRQAAAQFGAPCDYSNVVGAANMDEMRTRFLAKNPRYGERRLHIVMCGHVNLSDRVSAPRSRIMEVHQELCRLVDPGYYVGVSLTNDGEDDARGGARGTSGYAIAFDPLNPNSINSQLEALMQTKGQVSLGMRAAMTSPDGPAWLASRGVALTAEDKRNINIDDCPAQSLRLLKTAGNPGHYNTTYGKPCAADIGARFLRARYLVQ